jgi:hypothetical protein
MGWTTHFWKCNDCNHETVYTSRQAHTSKHHKCKIKERMQIEPSDFYRMYEILHRENKSKIKCGDQYEYWKKRVNERINYLTPLMNEISDKRLNLAFISKELNQEWLMLIEVKEYHNF